MTSLKNSIESDTDIVVFERKELITKIFENINIF